MPIVLPKAKRHKDSIYCWCMPEVVMRRTLLGYDVAEIVHNDPLGTYLGTWAARRLWDAQMERQGE